MMVGHQKERWGKVIRKETGVGGPSRPNKQLEEKWEKDWDDQKMVNSQA